MAKKKKSAKKKSKKASKKKSSGKKASKKKKSSKGAKNLVIVESRAKTKTIKKFLGRDFKVESCLGHVVDLPKSDLGIDVEGDFEPEFDVIQSRKKTIDRLRPLAKQAETVWLASDPDREGEFIAWSLCTPEALDLPADKARRVSFNQITKRAIEEAFEHPRETDPHRVEAQMTRRALDRLVGYPISKLLWNKIAYGLSAGRVQTVALRMIVEREKEIRAFTPEEYWKLTAALRKGEAAFEAELSALDGKGVKRKDLPDEKTAVSFKDEFEPGPWTVTKVQTKRRREKPKPPFETSTLQQQAWIKLRFGAKRTMRTAQNLYEGVDLGPAGSTALITYMRTDSVSMAPEAVRAVRDLVPQMFDEKHLHESERRWAAAGKTQEAHEAVRPTDLSLTPDELRTHIKPGRGKLTLDHWKLYDLIWRRTVASQMADAEYDHLTVEIGSGRGTFKVTGKSLVFKGHAALTGVNIPKNQQELPTLEEGETLELDELRPSQHFTKPPPRYTEATMVAELKKRGIGRPSTYAPILSNITDRRYVKLEKGRFEATDLGIVTCDMLVESFPRIFDYDFTSQMEESLDAIERAEGDRKAVLREFWEELDRSLERAKDEMTNIKGLEEPTDQVCNKEDCDAPLVRKLNKYGYYYACSRYPDCKNTCSIGPNGEPLWPEETEWTCSQGHPLLIKQGKNGQFFGCAGYPDHRETHPIGPDGEPMFPKETEHECNKCGSNLILKSGRNGEFFACSAYPECKNAISMGEDGKPLMPVEADDPCDKCGSTMVVKWGKRGPFVACTAFPKCRNTNPLTPELREKMGDRRPARRGARKEAEPTDTAADDGDEDFDTGRDPEEVETADSAD